MASLRVRLLRWLIVPILLVNVAAGALTYALAWLPARLAFDQSLLDAGTALAARVEGTAAAPRVDLPAAALRALRGDATDAGFFAVRDATGRLLAGDADFPDVPVRGGDGQPDGQAFDAILRGEAVRAVLLRADGGATVGVARTVRKRDQARAAIVRSLILLEAVITLVSAGLIWYCVTRGLQPLRRLRAALRGRADDDLAPIAADDVPDELEPVVRALNGLLEKAGDDVRARQQFLANVAHQLRTPLAGLHAQLDLLARPGSEGESAHAIGLMRASTGRMIRQVNQLLALARAEPGQGAREMKAVALDALVADTVQHFVEQAARKDIDLGFELAPATVRGDSFLLRDLVDNLVDNAIRYTPRHGRVTVACRQDSGGAELTVEDNGPGIPPARRADVFSRFVRLDEQSAGTGLGLAIVRDIAASHGATVAVDAGPGGQGACFTVRFPA
ncbi:sensor histidine kinase [Pseudoduganella buxea]|uniref:histidine kinase n=1 Tax=Pseudoduganella buxea TaxID=1949069 RepID=A0A6I3STB4_9BURK|nr:sensor histidine kinase [Pseudoduganella buxea]MTV52284.1 HAMP domain-containing protein [Pseudoduganella buxea]GGB86686.1 sensor histidine kinase [Pseudoduganella buxea]